MADFTNPSTIAGYGLQVTAVIFARISSFSGFGAITNLPEVLLAGFSALGIVLAFFVMAIQVFITLLEFYLVSMLALILVPFGVFRHTAFLAERAFGMILACGIKLMVLACITSAMLPVLVTLQIPADPAFKDILSLLLASLALAMLTWHAPSVAVGMMAGAPSLTASTAAHTAIAAGATVGLTALAGATALRGAGLTAPRPRTIPSWQALPPLPLLSEPVRPSEEPPSAAPDAALASEAHDAPAIDGP